MATEMDRSGFYHRRNDRSPEKSEYYKLPNQDKQLISHLRSVMDTARGNVTKLRDDVEDRERDLSRETALRKAAEARLDQLVDMYGDPAVNDELKNRLPRAKQTDPRKQAQEDLERLARQDEEADRRRSRSAEGDRRGRRRFRSHSGDSVDGRSRSHSPPGSRHRQHHFPGYMMPPMYPPYPMYPGYVMPGMVPPGMMPPGHSQPHMPNPNPNAQPNPMYSMPQMYSYPVPGATTNFGANQHFTNPAFQSNTGVKDGQTSESADREQKRQIAILVTELDQQRDLNKKLMDQLGEVQREIGSVKLNTETSEAAAAASDKMGKISDLIEEIYRGQQKRDAAVMGRLRVANEERDETLVKLKRLEEQDAGAALAEIDETIADILGSYSNEAASSATQYVENVTDVIRQKRQRRRDVTTEEMSAILKDRDIYFNKCKDLESEVLKLQRINRARATEKPDQSLLQAKLLTTLQERDVAVMKMRKLEEELQSLKLYYGLHKSLSPKPAPPLQDSVQDAIKTLKGQMLQESLTGHLQDDLQGIAKDKLQGHLQGQTLSHGALPTQLRDALAERDSATSELRQARSEARDAQENAKKLERLVNVLRRKINGLGSKVED